MTASHTIAAIDWGFSLSDLIYGYASSLTVASAMQNGHIFTNRPRERSNWQNAGISQRRDWSDIPATILRDGASIALAVSAFTTALAAHLGCFLSQLGWWGANPASLFLNGIAQAKSGS